MNIKYPLAKETINEEDIDALCDWLKTYPRLTKGELTPQFEKKWADFIGTKYAVFCNSGSSANLLMVYAAMLLKGIKKIVVPPVGWVTTISPAIQFGLEILPGKTDPKTFGIDLDDLERLCETESPDAVIFVQVLGVPHYKERLLDLKEKYGFVLLEDSCAALGASYKDGTMVGQVGDMSSFSFYFGHQLSTIEGGMVNTDDFETYKLLLMLRSHGWAKDLDQSSYDDLMNSHGIDNFHTPFTFFVPGFNLRSTDLQAFIGLRQMDKADWVVRRRHENHLEYARQLKDCVGFQDWGNDKPVSISFGALAESTSHRTEIVQRLVKHGVETRIFSAGNLRLHPFWEHVQEAIDPDEMRTRIHQTGFFLPNYPEMTSEDITFICSIVKGEVE